MRKEEYANLELDELIPMMCEKIKGSNRPNLKVGSYDECALEIRGSVLLWRTNENLAD